MNPATQHPRHGCPKCAHRTLPPAVMPGSYRLCAKCGHTFAPDAARYSAPITDAECAQHCHDGGAVRADA